MIHNTSHCLKTSNRCNRRAQIHTLDIFPSSIYIQSINKAIIQLVAKPSTRTSAMVICTARGMYWVPPLISYMQFPFQQIIPTHLIRLYHCYKSAHQRSIHPMHSPLIDAYVILPSFTSIHSQVAQTTPLTTPEYPAPQNHRSSSPHPSPSSRTRPPPTAPFFGISAARWGGGRGRGMGRGWGR